MPEPENQIDAPALQYSPEDERQAAELAPGELFRRLAQEPRNAAIRGKIDQIALRFSASPIMS